MPKFLSLRVPRNCPLSAGKFLGALTLGLSALSHASPPIKLRMVVWDGDEALKILKNEVKVFEEQNPGIEVKLENVDYRLYFQKLLTQYAANTAPDVAMLDPQNFQQFAKRGALLPIYPLAKGDKDVNFGDYYQPIVKAMEWKNELYVAPRDIAPIGLIYYNKRMFKEAGLALPDGSWTWDFNPRPELGSKCFTNCLEKLTVKDGTGKIQRWAFSASWTGAFTDTVAFSSGARYVDDPEAFKKLNFEDERVVKAFDWVANLALKQHWMPSSSELSSVAQTTAVDLFIAQKCAMYQCGIWDVPHIRAALKPGSKEFFDWDITVAPGHIDPATGKIIKAFPTGGSGYSIVSSTPHKEAAWKLVKFMAGPHAMKSMARAGIAQPAIRSIARGPDWVPDANAAPEQRYPANRIATDEAVPYVVFPPTADYWTEVSGLAFSKTEPIYLGTVSSARALKEGNRVAQGRLDAILSKGDLPPFNWTYGIALGLLLFAGIIAWIAGPELKNKRSSIAKKESRAGLLFVLPWIIGAVVFTMGPMILSLLMSLSDWDIITTAKWRGMANYQEAFFQDTRFWNALKVTGIYTLVAVPLGLIFALLLAVLLNQKIKGMPVYRTLFYLPTLASVVASSLLWMKIFQPESGLLNMILFGTDGKSDHFGLARFLMHGANQPVWLGDEKLALPSLIIMSLWGVGGAMVILLAGLQGVPEMYYEAAKLDGANAFLRFKVITVPLLSPALFFALVTGVIGSLQTFTQAFVMTQGGPNDSTRFYMLHLYDQAFGSLRMGYASALAWILFIIILGITIVQFRLNKLVYYDGTGQ